MNPPPTTIKGIQDFLNAHTNFELDPRGRTRDVFDLERMNELLNRLARPELSYRSAHVAGTKGKGSTCRFLASALKSQGLRVGLFTSPHLERLTERIEINGSEITEAEMVAAFAPLSILVESGNGASDVTFFELLTIAAMLAFQQANVDVAVFEVGLGGRLDSTNVITPLVSVITELGLDHTAQLGETIEEIAREKAGIIKPGVPVVCGASNSAALRIVQLTARDAEAPVLTFGRDYEMRGFRRDNGSVLFSLEVREQRYPEIILDHPARYMAENAAHALCALEVMAASPDYPGGALDRAAIAQALRETRLPGRFEIFKGSPRIVIDSAHNDLSIRAAIATAAIISDGPIVCVTGLASDKDTESCMKVLAEGVASAVFTPYYSPRETAPEELLALYSKFGGREGSIEEHPEAALEVAIERAGRQGLVLVTGSTYLAGLLRPVAAERAEDG